ncbi:MAG: hypothetical protein ACOY3K_03065 [Candidatus Omnitrophota bacterium]
MEPEKDSLGLLSVLHYVMGGLTTLFSCFPLIHLLIGIAILMGKIPAQEGNTVPAAAGWFFVIPAGLFILGGWAVGFCLILAGRRLAQRRQRMFCLVMAGIECCFVPLGTILGVFTILELTKGPVKAAFDDSSRSV